MALKRFKGRSGTLVTLEHDSRVLRGNPLGDPHVRKLGVWLPPQYDEGAGRGRGRRFPVLYDMVGFTGSGLSHVGWRAFGDNLPERAARLMHERKMGPVIFVFPDCFTALGGNQYINSSAIGRYADYLTREIIPFVDSRVPHARDRARHRGCFGKSSGGYGAIIHGMKYAEHWGAIGRSFGRRVLRFRLLARLAEYAQRAREASAKPKRKAGRYDVASAAARRGLAEGLDDGRVTRFLDDVWTKEKLGPAEGHCIMNLCMAATYDPDPKAPLGFRVPFNLETGERDRARWKRWLDARPVHLVDRYRRRICAALRDLHRLRLARPVSHPLRRRASSRSASAAPASRMRYEEFDDNHSDIDYRMDVSLPFLYRALKP